MESAVRTGSANLDSGSKAELHMAHPSAQECHHRSLLTQAAATSSTAGQGEDPGSHLETLKLLSSKHCACHLVGDSEFEVSNHF